MRNPLYVIIPNLNGKDFIAECLSSLEKQTSPLKIVVVDNGSTDGSDKIAESQFPNIILLSQDKNHGFAGGVNIGIRYAIKNGAEFVLLLNNDAVADKDWVKHLINELEKSPDIGIATGKILNMDTNPSLDSTGEQFSNWGLAFPRGRGGTDINRYDDDDELLGASGGASAYRVKMLKEIGLFDKDFFAYYEDVDLAFRARLANWKVIYVPKALVRHHIGGTTKKLTGFTTYQAFKNQPWVITKNLPFTIWLRVVPRFIFAYLFFFMSALVKGKGWYAFKGALVALIYLPKKIWQRWAIQHSRKIKTRELWQLFYKGVPPDYSTLYKLVYFYKR